METMMTLWQTLQRLEAHLGACAEAQGLEKDDAVLLGALSENPDLSMKTFARSMRLPLASLEGALARLHGKALVTRDDGGLTLTPQGVEKLRVVQRQLDPDGVLAQFCVSWSDLGELLHELQQRAA